MRRWLIPGVLLGLGLLHLLSYWQPFDDLYITLRYARNLVEGEGLRFNPGDGVDGFSSLVWVLVAAPIVWLGLPPDATLKVLCIAAALALLMWTRREAQARSGDGLMASACALVMVASGSWAFWTATGMETTPFALLIFAAAVGLARGDGARWWPAVCLAVATLTRPEGIGYAVALIAVTALGCRRRAAESFAVVGAVFGVYFAWHWQRYGHPLPNTFYAKVGDGAPWRGLVGLEEYLSSQMAWLLVAASGWVAVTRWRQPWVRIHAAVIVAAMANVVIVGGHTFGFHRFMLPALAPMLVLTCVAIGDVARAVDGRTAHARGWAAFAVACLALWTFIATVRVPVAWLSEQDLPPRAGVMRAARYNRGYRLIGQWLRKTMPPDTLLAVNAAGIIPYYSRLPTIDMLGLNDAHIAHRDMPVGRGAIGHEKHDAQYVLERRPGVILLGLPRLTDGPLRTGEQLRAHVQVFFGNLPGDRQLFLDPTFRSRYVPRSVRVAPGKWLTLFIDEQRLAELGEI